ncbi:MAG: NUDIX domain-containing protein [Gemmatimonadota bacterium]
MSPLEALIDRLRAHSPRGAEALGRPQAAVAVLLVSDPDRLLLIRRALRTGDPWSGHLALPGGRREAIDGDLLDTAIRETWEETGVRLDRAYHVATLDDLAPQIRALAPIMVRPFLFRLDDASTPGLSAEVAEARWVELEYLTRPGVFRSSPILVAGAERVVEGYHLPEGFLWGLTEQIVTPILRQWKELTRPGS